MESMTRPTDAYGLSVHRLPGKIIFPLSSVYSPLSSVTVEQDFFFIGPGAAEDVTFHVEEERSFSCEICCQICSPATHSVSFRLNALPMDELRPDRTGFWILCILHFTDLYDTLSKGIHQASVAQ